MKGFLGRSNKKTQPSVDLGTAQIYSNNNNNNNQSSSSQPPQARSKPAPAAFLDAPELTGYSGTKQPTRAASQRQSTIGPSPGTPLYGHRNQSEDKLSSHRLSSLASSQLPSPDPSQDREHKRGFRSKFGLGHSSSRQSIEQYNEGGQGSSASLARANSASKKGSFSSERLAQATTHADSGRGPSWSTAGSNPHLNAHPEEEEENTQLDYETRQPGYPHIERAQVLDATADEHYYSPNTIGRQQFQPPPQHIANPQAYYQNAGLHRINTEQSPYTAQDQHLSPNPHSAYHQDNSHTFHQQSHEQYQQGYQQHPGASPAYPRYPEGYGAHNHPLGVIDNQRPRSQASSSRFDGSSTHGSRTSFEHPSHQHYESGDHVHIGQARLAQHPGQSSEDQYLHPPSANASHGHHPPPSPLQAGRDQPLLGTPQPPSPPEDQATPMPRDPRTSKSTRQPEGRGLGAPGSRESAISVPPTPGFAQSAPATQGGGRLKSDEKGRQSPAPQGTNDDEATALQNVQREYKELRDKYQKVKKYYFEKEAQVHNLQNTIAHQRLSQSRTSLDDSEYTARFGRLDGLISQLAFGIRKSWKAIPPFLQCAVNKDAIAVGKQEMTAVGRAFISHWLVTELFDEYFHPDLELGLNVQLRQIFGRIRASCPPFQSKEEEEALNSKMINWRMTTLEGLQQQLNSVNAPQNRQALQDLLRDKLTSDMTGLLQDPTPPELATGVHMIVELAINIAIHLPLESRDVVIEYYLPGDPVQPTVMKIETGIPVLANAIAPFDTDAEHANLQSAAGSSEAKMETPEDTAGTPGASSKEELARQKKGGMFSAMLGGSGSSAGTSGRNTISKTQPPGSSGVVAQQGSRLGPSNVNASTAAPPPPAAGAIESGGVPSAIGLKDERIRLAAGVSVQIRGRSVLAKAPVYTLAGQTSI